MVVVRGSRGLNLPAHILGRGLREGHRLMTVRHDLRGSRVWKLRESSALARQNVSHYNDSRTFLDGGSSHVLILQRVGSPTWSRRS
jgi:hypothetical protein